MTDVTQIARMLEEGYKDSGGCLFSAEELIKKADDLTISLDTKDQSKYSWSVASKRTPYGRKLISAGTDGQHRSKAEMYRHLVGIATDPSLSYYSEQSGPIQKMLDRLQVRRVPAVEVATILGKPVTILGEFEYERPIQGVVTRKTMYGYPVLQP